jgi:aminodeoxyfutalosine synthase
MLSLFAQSELKDLIEKVEQGERLGYEDGIRLMVSKDILALGYMANIVRERKNGDRTYFVVNRDTNLTNGLSLLGIKDAAQKVTRENISEGWATLLYGQNESVEDNVNHLIQLRELQDKSGGFLTFIPLPFYPESTTFEGSMGVQSITGFEDLRMLSVSRILLDNFDHIKAYWILLGPKLAQVSLHFGVDDLDGNVVEKRVSQDASSETEQVMNKSLLLKMIHKAGRHAIERDSLYQVLKDYGREGGEA